MTTLPQRILTGFADWFFPRFCVVCGRAGSYACADCEAKLPRVPEPFCPVCGRPFPRSATPAVIPPSHPCGACLKDPPAYETHRALFLFEGIARELVHKLKYGAAFWVAEFFRERLDELTEILRGAETVTAVPLHTGRLKERGYNQSLLLAQAVARKFRSPLLREAIHRTRPTPPQTGLTRPARRENLAGAFTVPDPASVRGKTVLLVDDVHTTGTTLDACAAALKRAGAARVRALSFAVVPADVRERDIGGG